MILNIFIALLPGNFIRIFAYKKLLKFHIESDAKIGYGTVLIGKNICIGEVKIGFFNIINAEYISIKNGTSIGNFNKFKNLKKVAIDSNVVIVNKNNFFGTKANISPYKNFEIIKIGRHTTITSSHIFDISDTIEIMNSVVIGGIGSQFWTHGFDVKRIKIQAGIKIENNVYFGSSCLIMPGVKISENVMVGAGSVVYKDILEDGFYTSHKLIKVCNAKIDNSDVAIEFNGNFFARR